MWIEFLSFPKKIRTRCKQETIDEFHYNHVITKKLPNLLIVVSKHFCRRSSANEKMVFHWNNILEIIYAYSLKRTSLIFLVTIAVDFLKAFDTLTWPFIFNPLNAFGFNNEFCNWISTLYKGAQSCKINNGFISPRLLVMRWDKEILPFRICIEIPNIAIQNNMDIFGILLPNREIKTSMLADDTPLFLRADQNSDFRPIHNLLESFGEVSGCSINATKSQAFNIDSKRSYTDQPLSQIGMKWP